MNDEPKPVKETLVTINTEKLEKTTENKDRWVRISTPDLEVLVSSKNENDKLEDINKMAKENFEFAIKKKNEDKPEYTG